MSNEVDCKGCLHFEDPTISCKVIPRKHEAVCPCAKCLVKMVCNSECPEYIWYYGYIRHNINVPEREGITNG